MPLHSAILGTRLRPEQPALANTLRTERPELLHVAIPPRHIWGSAWMTCTAKDATTLRAGTEGRRNDQMQCVVAHQARPLGRRGELACRRLQRSRQRVPVQMDRPFRLPSAYLHRKTMHLHRDVQCLNPLNRHPRGILARQIVELRAIVVSDRLRPLLLAASPRVILRGAPWRGASPPGADRYGKDAVGPDPGRGAAADP